MAEKKLIDTIVELLKGMTLREAEMILHKASGEINERATI